MCMYRSLEMVVWYARYDIWSSVVQKEIYFEFGRIISTPSICCDDANAITATSISTLFANWMLGGSRGIEAIPLCPFLYCQSRKWLGHNVHSHTNRKTQGILIEYSTLSSRRSKLNVHGISGRIMKTE